MNDHRRQISVLHRGRIDLVVCVDDDSRTTHLADTQIGTATRRADICLAALSTKERHTFECLGEVALGCSYSARVCSLVRIHASQQLRTKFSAVCGYVLVGDHLLSINDVFRSCVEPHHVAAHGVALSSWIRQKS